MTTTTILSVIKSMNLEVETQKIQIAYEGHHAAENGKTITEIAADYGVSRRTVNRYMDKYEEQVEDIDVLLAEQAPVEEKVEEVVEEWPEQAEPLTEEQVEEAFADEPEAEENVEEPKAKKANVSETYAKIVEIEVKSRSGRVRTRPSKHSVAIFEQVSGDKEAFFTAMYDEGKSKSFVEREYRRANMYMEQI